MQNNVSEKRIFRFFRIGKEVLYPILALSVCFLCYYFLFKTNHFYPFDIKEGKTMLMIDAQSQYISYLRYFRRTLLDHDSFVYTLAKVFGGDFLSIYTYYLGSPFNFLIVFFSEADIPSFMLLASVLKMMLASLFMYFLFRSHEKEPKLISIGFSLCYSLLGYAFVYLSNFMWLDAVMILPLVVLGIKKLYQRKMRWLYPISLFYALICSWYTGAMICVFSVLLFLVLFFSDTTPMKKKKRRILDFAFFSVVGGFIGAFSWVSAFLHFGGTKVHTNFPSNHWYSITYLIDGFFSETYQSTSDICKNEGYLPAFCSIVSLIFFIHYFFNSNYPLRERLSFLTIFLIYAVMGSNSVSNTLLHFGSSPTWFPARYSFLLSFLVCYLAYLHQRAMEKEKLTSYVIGDLLIVILVLLALFVKNELGETVKIEKMNYIFMAVALGINLLVILLSMFKKLGKARRPLSYALSLMVLPVCVASSYLGGDHVLKTNSDSYQEVSTYLEDDSYTKTFDILKEYDKSDNYRMEATFNRPGNYNEVNNNPMFYQYNGLNHFSSSEQKDVEEYFHSLGFHYNYYFERFDGGSTLGITSLLGLKYLIDDSSDSYDLNQPIYEFNYPYQELEDLHSDKEEIRYYQNPLALPLGFVTDSSDYDYVSEGRRIEGNPEKIHWYDDFEYQNEIFREMNDSIKEDIYHKMDTVTTLKGLKLTSYDEETLETRYTGKKGDYISFAFKDPDIEHYNLYFGIKNWNSKYDVYIDDRKVECTSYWHKGIRSINPKRKNHVITLKLNRDVEDDLLIPEIYYEDISVLERYITELKSQSAMDLKKNSSYLSFGYEGSFELKEEDKSFLFSLPYDKNFSVYIDGKKMEVQKRFNIFTSVSLKGLQKGRHEIRILYSDRGLKYGSLISCMGIIALVFGLVFFKNEEEKKQHRRNLLIKGL